MHISWTILCVVMRVQIINGSATFTMVLQNRSSPWWRHQMETFSALLGLCAGNSPVPGEFPAQRPVARSFDVFLDLCLNKRLRKQSWGWWFETPSCPLWGHCNAAETIALCKRAEKSPIHVCFCNTLGLIMKIYRHDYMLIIHITIVCYVL